MRVETLRPALSGLGALASIASGAFFAAPDQAHAQETAPAPKPDEATIRLPAVKVEGTGAPSTNALKTGTGIDRLPGALKSTPQTLTVIPQVVIEQQQATTVDQVLKYVPGVTVATGEGGGGMNGDAFRIRGFDAQGDLYVDGLRDFGAYVRDSFATENIQVFKGSSSASFGNGATGGVINQESKKAHLGDSYSLEGTLGTASQQRVVADLNKQLNNTTALRIVGMWHDQDIAKRDHAYSKRRGVLGSLGFGLGTDQTLTINYLHQEGDRRPDMGVPIPISTTGAYPVTEYGVPRSNFFGKETDRDKTDVDMVTMRYQRQIGDWLTISNDTRYASYTRRMVFTPTMCGTGFAGFANFGTCSIDVLSGNLNTAYTVWPVVGVTQKSTGGQNITTAIARFNTGGLRHELVTGLDIYYQRNLFGGLTGSIPRTGGTLLDPDFTNPSGFEILGAPVTRARASDIGLFASDRVWFNNHISVVGGLRRDRYKAKTANYDVAAGGYGEWTEGETKFLSPKASLIWEPSSGQNYYLSYARSFTPQGQNISFLGAVSPAQPELSPDKNYTLELGGKWSLLDDQLGLTAAAFRTIKNRGSYADPLTGASVSVGEKDRVQGVELGVTGKLNPAWDVQASYTYLDSKILEAPGISFFTPVDATGNRVAYVSKNNLAIWSTYNVAPLIPGMPGKLLIGGGVNYRSGYSADPTDLYRIPAATTVDAMVSYEVDRYRFALNVTNLTNKLTYDSAFYYRAGVAPGRVVALTASLKF